MKKLFLALSALVLQGCALASPFKGPLYDDQTGKLKLDPDRKVIMALTNAKLIRSKRKGFDRSSSDIYKNIDKSEGYIGGSVRFKLLGDQVWTMTVWESKEALQKFVNSTKHLDAMYMENDAISYFRTLNVEVRAGDLPYTWKQAEELLNQKPMAPHKVF